MQDVHSSEVADTRLMAICLAETSSMLRNLRVPYDPDAVELAVSMAFLRGYQIALKEAKEIVDRRGSNGGENANLLGG